MNNIFSVTINLLSAKAVNLDYSKILSFGKAHLKAQSTEENRHWLQASTFDFLPNDHDLKQPCSWRSWKTFRDLWKNKICLWNTYTSETGIFWEMWPWYLTLTFADDLETSRYVLMRCKMISTVSFFFFVCITISHTHFYPLPHNLTF